MGIVRDRLPGCVTRNNKVRSEVTVIGPQAAYQPYKSWEWSIRLTD